MAYRSGIPVLTYHSNNVSDNHYVGNDHVALKMDLRALHEAGWHFISLQELHLWHSGQDLGSHGRKRIALTFDDGSDFDFHDLHHPHCGEQRSLFNVLKDFSQEYDAPVTAASFVIASEAARSQLDQRSLIGAGWWNDDWWAPAQASGLMSIESHGWDHLHPVLDETAHSRGESGNFHSVDNFDDAERQLRRSAEYIARRTGGHRPRFFAYPWGQASDYLVEDYFPNHQQRHGYYAAFTTRPAAVTRDYDRWRLPRFVCGEHWSSTDELLALLKTE